MNWRTSVVQACVPWLLLVPAFAQGAGPDDERQRLAQQRAAIESEFERGERACAQRFAVTQCVDGLKEQRRSALAELRRKEVALEEAERRAAALANRKRLQDKQAKAAARAQRVQAAAQAASQPSGAPASAGIAKGAARPEPAQPDPAGAGAGAGASAPAAAQRPWSSRQDGAAQGADAASEAARRAEAQADRLEKAEQRRQRVEQRNAERAAQGKTAAPLPDPAAASSPAR